MRQLSKPSSKSAGKAGEILGCIGARIAADRRGFDAAPAGTFDRLKQLAAGWHEIDPSDIVRETARRLLRVHPLRVADALQLAAAFIAAEQRPASLEMITLDDRLASAARKEGFAVIDIAGD